MSLALPHRPIARERSRARLTAAITQLIERHGRWRVLRAILLVPDLRRVDRLRTGDLSDHLRRDMGLAPDARDHPTLLR